MNKYFKLPLKIWEISDDTVFDANNSMAFDFAFSFTKEKSYINISEEQKQKVVNIINGNEKPTKNVNLTYKNGIIYVDNLEFILIRSWGRLTGLLKLPLEEARQAQDEFAEFIIKKLTPYETN